MCSYAKYQNNFVKYAGHVDQFRAPKVMTKDKERNDDWKDKIIDWGTFYRRNIHRFIQHYFQVELYWYQVIWIYFMSICENFVAIASRSVAKSWIIALLALAVGVLYPNSEIVIVSVSMKTAGIIFGKIERLIGDYPNINREVARFSNTTNNRQCVLHNGTTIKVVACQESGRGKIIKINIIILHKTKSLKEEIMMNKKEWSQDELVFMKENYHIKTNDEISKILNRTKSSVKMKAIRLGLKKPEKRVYDETVFEKIDTEEKAYWLGFILADGTINCDYISHNYELSIELKESDSGHIKKFIDFIKTDADVKFRTRYSKSIDCTTTTAFVRIYSKKIIEDLINKNVCQRKTFLIEYPKLDNTFFIWFLRGFFDGDGSIYYYKRRNCYQANITYANKEFLELLQSKLKNLSINCYITTYTNSYKTKMYQLQIKGKKNARNFFELLYKNSTIHLDRKYELYLNCLNK